MKIEKNNYIWPVVKVKKPSLLNQIVTFDNQVKDFKTSKAYKKINTFLDVFLISLITYLLILITVFLMGNV